jgi:small subunit ribosomal protein S5
MAETTAEKKNTTTAKAPSGSVRRVVRRGDRGGRKGRGKKGDRRERSEFNQRVMSIRRVTRVMKGGRRFSFSVALVLGDGKGRVGVGTGKANDTILAIEKATRAAKKNMITVAVDKETGSLPYEVTSVFCSSHVLIKPNNGRGVVAGSSVRDVLELAGIKDVSGKLLSRSKNKLNNAQAAIGALQQIKGNTAKKKEDK